MVEPLAATWNIVVPVEEATMRAGLAPAVPTTESVAKGVVVPMPTLPVVVITINPVPVEELT